MMRKLILTCVTLLLMAQSYAQKVIFPQAQQAGTATSSFSEDTYTLANDLLSATFIHADGKLTFGVRYFRDNYTETQNSFNSNGTITWSCEVIAPELLFDGNTAANVFPAPATDISAPLLAVGGTRTDAWTPSSWSVPDEVPSRINELGYTSDRIQTMEKSVGFSRGECCPMCIG